MDMDGVCLSECVCVGSKQTFLARCIIPCCESRGGGKIMENHISYWCSVCMGER